MDLNSFSRKVHVYHVLCDTHTHTHTEESFLPCLGEDNGLIQINVKEKVCIKNMFHEAMGDIIYQIGLVVLQWSL